ncbi:MAG: hypothetical protein QNK37_06905 [Acidobacteriota bacterium]|nr:hypothetical protein [Acidobacteriota bacterium]
MVTLICALICLLGREGETSPLERAKALKAQGDFLQAEGHYLDLVLTGDNALPVALDLAEIALVSGNIEGKQQFYQSLLTRSREWRGAALLVLSILHASERDFNGFRNYARLWFTEYNRPHWIRYNLTYYLARYTEEDPESLNLTAAERAWFDACRVLPPQSRYPDVAHADLPYYLANLHLLEQTGSFVIPPPPLDDGPLDRYVAALLRIHEAINREDLAPAAKALNEYRQTGRDLGRLDLHLIYTELMLRFFQVSEMPDREARTRTNLMRWQKWSLLPLLALPDYHIPPKQIQAGSETTEVETAPPVAETPEETQAPVIEAPTEETPETVAVPPEDDYASLDRRLRGGEKGLEFKIRALPSRTTYRKIYKNYLLGLQYLNSGLNGRAEEHLSLALKLIEDLPFPLLETKILMGMARYYEAMDDRDKADWYRIDAVQIWNAPENIPVFNNKVGPDEVSPHQVLIDRALLRATKEDVTGQLLYYSELDTYIRQRRHAYRRGALARNPIIDNQIQQLGGQLYGMVDNLATNPDSSATPTRFNQILEVWNSSWSQSLPWYLDAGIPSMNKVQSLLKQRENLIAFVEGDTNLGVLLLSNSQAFALDLGSKRTFLNLNEEERLGFLSSRLGPVWDREGTLFLHLPPALRNAGMIETFRKRMENPRRLRLLLSLKSFAGTLKMASQCNDGLIMTSGFMPDMGSSGQKARWETLVLRGLPRDQMEKSLSNYGHLVYAGQLKLEENGLRLGPQNLDFFFHQIVHYNSSLCSLTLVATNTTAWGPVLDELALIDPGAGFAITLIDEPDKLSNTDILKRTPGLMVP